MYSPCAQGLPWWAGHCSGHWGAHCWQKQKELPTLGGDSLLVLTVTPANVPGGELLRLLLVFRRHHFSQKEIGGGQPSRVPPFWELCTITLLHHSIYFALLPTEREEEVERGRGGKKTRKRRRRGKRRTRRGRRRWKGRKEEKERKGERKKENKLN